MLTAQVSEGLAAWVPVPSHRAVARIPLRFIRAMHVRKFALRRGLMAREFGLVQFELLGGRFRDAGAGAQPLVIGFHVGPFCQLDRRRRHRPVDDGDEIGIGHAEVIEQEFAALR